MINTSDWIQQREDDDDKLSAEIYEGNVVIAYNANSHYYETFTTREDLEAFISYLRTVADQAWPSQPS